MLSNFCVVIAITWNVSVVGGAAGPAEAGLEATRLGAAAVEPHDESPTTSVTATAAASPHLPRIRLMRWSPRALCSDLDRNLEAAARYPALARRQD
jgi:hypothetical protein